MNTLWLPLVAIFVAGCQTVTIHSDEEQLNIYRKENLRLAGRVNHLEDENKYLREILIEKTKWKWEETKTIEKE